jgi:hypothetical protein
LSFVVRCGTLIRFPIWRAVIENACHPRWCFSSPLGHYLNLTVLASQYDQTDLNKNKIKTGQRLKSTQYKKLSPNSLWSHIKIWNLANRIKKRNKNYQKAKSIAGKKSEN